MTNIARKSWIDVCKGVAILLVVVGHAIRGLYAKGLIAEPSFTAIDSRIYSFHMPVFFALSGYFLLQQIQKQPVPGFVAGRTIRLFWPMVLWTYIFLTLRWLGGEYANATTEFTDILRLPVPGYLHLWFLWALFVQSIVLAFVLSVLPSTRAPGIILLCLFAGTVGLALAPLPNAVVYWVGPAVQYAPFLVLGALLRVAIDVLGMGSAKDHTKVAVLGVCFGVLIALWPNIELGAVATLAVQIVLTGIFVLVFAYVQWGSGRLTKGLIVLGVFSLPIYLAHTIFSALTRGILLDLSVTSFWVHLSLGTLFGVVGPLLMALLAKRFNLSRVLGI